MSLHPDPISSPTADTSRFVDSRLGDARPRVNGASHSPDQFVRTVPAQAAHGAPSFASEASHSSGRHIPLPVMCCILGCHCLCAPVKAVITAIGSPFVWAEHQLAKK